jgi:NAD(P)-dependent dehydrogenase (short-subunit alcohol dehydrogenase family)
MDSVSRRLDERIALVTGAASGIGRAIAIRFVTEGAQVALVDRNAAVLTEVQEELGAACITVVADVSIEADIARAVSRTVEAFGRLDIAVNAAGVGDGNLITLMEEEQWDRVHGTCLKGVFLSMKYEGRQMTAQGDGGVVINISSLNSQQPAVGVGAYCAAKAGVNMLTQVGAMELGPAKIRVCGIAPGLIDTPMSASVMGIPEVKEAYLDNIPLGRVGTPADIAGAAAFLASDDAGWISGITLFVDGASSTMRYPDVIKILAGNGAGRT